MVTAKELESKSFINLGVVLNAKGEVLMIRRVRRERSENGGVLEWAFPGGKQKLKESRKECLERELLAETGYKVTALKEISMRFHPQFPVIIVYHLCELAQKEPFSPPSEPWEIAEIKWVKPEKIRGLITSNLDAGVAKELEI